MATRDFIGTLVPRKTILHYESSNIGNIDLTGLDGVDTNMFYVYHHYKADTNELFYVGKGIRDRAISTANRNIYWHNIVNKHKCYIKIIAQNLTQEEAFTIEVAEICKHGRLNNNTGILVNMTDGGDGSVGLTYTAEMREARSKLMTGEGNHQFGIHKFGNENGNFGNKYEKNPLSKPVLCFTLANVLVKRYTSLSETELDGFNPSVVSKCCVGERTHNKEHRFMYEEDYTSGKRLDEYVKSKTSKRAVVGIDNNNIYKVYESAQVTAVDGYNPKVVQQCCAKQKKSHQGIKWFYYDEIKDELLRYSLNTSES